jgi:hypothetical protein
MRCGYKMIRIILLLGLSCYIRLDHVEIVLDDILTWAGCSLNTNISCAKAVSDIRGVYSYLSLESE